jgi:hypothetical protein
MGDVPYFFKMGAGKHETPYIFGKGFDILKEIA